MNAVRQIAATCLAPLAKAVGVPSGNAEHIQTSNRHLNKQNAAALNILEENL